MMNLDDLFFVSFRISELSTTSTPGIDEAGAEGADTKFDRKDWTGGSEAACVRPSVEVRACSTGCGLGAAVTKSSRGGAT